MTVRRLQHELNHQDPEYTMIGERLRRNASRIIFMNSLMCNGLSCKILNKTWKLDKKNRKRITHY